MSTCLLQAVVVVVVASLARLAVVVAVAVLLLGTRRFQSKLIRALSGLVARVAFNQGLTSLIPVATVEIRRSLERALRLLR